MYLSSPGLFLFFWRGLTFGISASTPSPRKPMTTFLNFYKERWIPCVQSSSWYRSTFFFFVHQLIVCISFRALYFSVTSSLKWYLAPIYVWNFGESCLVPSPNLVLSSWSARHPFAQNHQCAGSHILCAKFSWSRGSTPTWKKDLHNWHKRRSFPSSGILIYRLAALAHTKNEPRKFFGTCPIPETNLCNASPCPSW